MLDVLLFSYVVYVVVVVVVLLYDVCVCVFVVSFGMARLRILGNATRSGCGRRP